MNNEQAYQQSNARLIEYERRHKDFFDRFYRNFMSSSEAIRDKFRNTDVQHQTTLLKNFLVHLQSFYQTGTASEQLERVAKLHSKKEKDIPPEYYQVWLDAFFRTLEQCDEKFTDKDRQAWLEVLEPGIAFMQSYYE